MDTNFKPEISFEQEEVKEALIRYLGFNCSQKQGLRFRFADNVTKEFIKKYGEISYWELRKKVDSVVNDTYSVLNIELIQSDPTPSDLTYEKLGFEDYIWIATLCNYVTELIGLGLLKK